MREAALIMLIKDTKLVLLLLLLLQRKYQFYGYNYQYAFMSTHLNIHFLHISSYQVFGKIERENFMATIINMPSCLHKLAPELKKDLII